MDFKDLIHQIQERVEKFRSNTSTEEATKNAFIMPMIAALGYDVFNPMEVIPEYTCSVGLKKGDRIDYAIMKDGEPIILIECKQCDKTLELCDDQLLRYFHGSKAKFGVLTNGVIYRFYTDLDKTNVMDSKPFLEIDLSDIAEPQIEELRKFHKSYFDVENILTTASEMKYMSQLKHLIIGEFSNPSPEFVRYFAKQAYPGSLTAKVVEQFSDLTKRSISQVITDAINQRLKNALSKTEEQPQNDKPQEQEKIKTNEAEIITTEEELQGFYIVCSILAKNIPLKRVVHRDTLSYFGILLDDNNRKPICRLLFNGSKKYIVTFDENKKETKYPIEELNDIYQYADQLIETVGFYEK